MSIRKKAIISLTTLLACCIAAAGCAFQTGSGQAIIADSSDSSAAISAPTGSSDSTEAASADTTAPMKTEPPLAATGSTEVLPTTSTTSAPAASTPAANLSVIMLDSLFGQSAAHITQRFGSPYAIEKSEYGFNWYVYHNNYSRFVMIGIQNSKVIGLYSNSADLLFENLKVGAAKNFVRQALRTKGYTGPMESVLKGNTNYTLPLRDERDTFTDGQKYVTVFYDNTKGGILAAVQIIDYATEQGFGYLSAPDTQLTESYEKISFCLINSIRVRFGLQVLQYDTNMAKVAAAHSQDMMNRNYFAHLNREGLEVDGRIKAAGYSYRRCGENIAKDHPSAVSAHENYLNSPGHRDNILGDFKHVGVGVKMDGKSILQTQVFVTYP